jgi:predicted RND superfamily exporter protein
VLFVALAVSAGFAVNVVSDFRALQLMGWFVPVTMLVSCLTTLTLLPSIVVLRRPGFIFRRAATPLPPPPERRQAVG